MTDRIPRIVNFTYASKPTTEAAAFAGFGITDEAIKKKIKSQLKNVYNCINSDMDDWRTFSQRETETTVERDTFPDLGEIPDEWRSWAITLLMTASIVRAGQPEQEPVVNKRKRELVDDGRDAIIRFAKRSELRTVPIFSTKSGVLPYRNDRWEQVDDGGDTVTRFAKRSELHTVPIISTKSGVLPYRNDRWHIKTVRFWSAALGKVLVEFDAIDVSDGLTITWEWLNEKAVAFNDEQVFSYRGALFLFHCQRQPMPIKTQASLNTALRHMLPGSIATFSTRPMKTMLGNNTAMSID